MKTLEQLLQEKFGILYNRCPFDHGDCCMVLHEKSACKLTKRSTWDIPLMTDCNLVKRCLRAFDKREYGVIQFFYNKVSFMDDWELFVVGYTKHTWAYWKLRVGLYLIDECKKDNKCPFKVLTSQ